MLVIVLIKVIQKILKKIQKNIKKDEQKEYIEFAKEIIKNTTLQLFYSNIDLNLFGDDIFGSKVIYLPLQKITISYLIGVKYSSSNYYEPSIALFDSKISNGKISINWGAYDYFKHPFSSITVK